MRCNFGGGQVDITSGKYVFQCTEAYKIENGKIGAPVKGAMLIGNGPTDLHRISMIGNDLAARHRHRHLRQERPGRAGRRRPADAAHGPDHGRRDGVSRAQKYAMLRPQIATAIQIAIETMPARRAAAGNGVSGGRSCTFGAVKNSNSATFERPSAISASLT